MDIKEVRKYLVMLCRDEATEHRITVMSDSEINQTLIGMRFIQAVFSSPAVTPIIEDEGEGVVSPPFRERVIGLIDSLDIQLALMIAEAMLTE